MSDNVHRHLDGDISRAGVPLPEQEALREMDEAIMTARAWVRRQDVPDLTSRVMSAIIEEGVAHGAIAHSCAELVDARVTINATAEARSAGNAPARKHHPAIAKVVDGIRWLWAPHPIRVRPALAGGFALVLLGVLIGPDPSTSPPASVGAGADAGFVASSPVYIQFRLDAADASNVALAGTFTEWQPTYPLHESGPGVWTVTVPLEPGVHDYLFIVDGERWVPDPAATPVDDGFGGTNSRLLLSAPQSEA